MAAMLAMVSPSMTWYAAAVARLGHLDTCRTRRNGTRQHQRSKSGTWAEGKTAHRAWAKGHRDKAQAAALQPHARKPSPPSAQLSGKGGQRDFLSRLQHGGGIGAQAGVHGLEVGQQDGEGGGNGGQRVAALGDVEAAALAFAGLGAGGIPAFKTRSRADTSVGFVGPSWQGSMPACPCAADARSPECMGCTQTGRLHGRLPGS